MAANSDIGLVPEQKLGSYVLLEKLGAGGLGEVWKARDPRLNRIVALKFISAVRRGSSPARELLREARAASGLNHPNIVTIFEVGESPTGTYLAMEFVEGETLRERLQRAFVPLDEALDIATQIAAGLAAAHRNGIVHRDLKPENIMLRADAYVKLVDFGLAKLLPWAEATTTDSSGIIAATQTGQLVGTFTYMSPEQARGRPVTSASDVFSFGIVLYELFTGKHPFRGPSPMDTLSAILNQEPASVRTLSPAVPEPVSGIVARALRKEPGERFASAVELAEGLKQARAAHPPALAPAPSAVTPKPRWMQALGVALIAALLLLAGWFFRPAGFFRSGEPADALQVQSIAVMNFRTPPDDPAAAVLAQSLPEDLGVALAGAGLQVASHSSVLELPESIDLRSLGSQLGVDAVLEGSIRSYGSRFRVHCELVSTRTGFQLWSGTLTTEGEDLFVSSQKAAADITAQLRAALAGQR